MSKVTKAWFAPSMLIPMANGLLPTSLILSSHILRLVSGGEDGTVRVWEVATAREIMKFSLPRVKATEPLVPSKVFWNPDPELSLIAVATPVHILLSLFPLFTFSIPSSCSTQPKWLVPPKKNALTVFLLLLPQISSRKKCSSSCDGRNPKTRLGLKAIACSSTSVYSSPSLIDYES